MRYYQALELVRKIKKIRKLLVLMNCQLMCYGQGVLHPKKKISCSYTALDSKATYILSTSLTL